MDFGTKKEFYLNWELLSRDAGFWNKKGVLSSLGVTFQRCWILEQKRSFIFTGSYFPKMLSFGTKKEFYLNWELLSKDAEFWNKKGVLLFTGSYFPEMLSSGTRKAGAFTEI